MDHFAGTIVDPTFFTRNVFYSHLLLLSMKMKDSWTCFLNPLLAHMRFFFKLTELDFNYLGLYNMCEIVSPVISFVLLTAC